MEMGAVEAAKRGGVVTTLIDNITLDDDPTSYNSAALDVSGFSKFLLYLKVDSTSAPTTVQFKVQFSDDGGTTWYTYKQGPFASLYYEDGDTATAVTECFSGDCAGRLMRIAAVGTGTDGTNKFTISAKVELYN